MIDGSSFEGTSQKFNRIEQTVRGAIRYELVRKNLAPYIQEGITVLDVSGGSGADSAWLAQQGCNVTLLQPDATLVDIAFDRRSTLSKAQRDRFVIKQGELKDVRRNRTFGAVLLHDVVAPFNQTYDDYRKEAYDHIASGGILSMLELGRRAAAKRLDRKNDIVNMIIHDKTSTYTDERARVIHTVTPDSVEAFRLAVGAPEPLHMAGVGNGVEYDTRLKSDLEKKEWETIFARSAKDGERPIGMIIAKYLHTILRKP